MPDNILALVAAVARNGVIGSAGGLPWRLPSDLKRFKATTLGKPVIMGRKTFDSIGRALPGRPNIVVTRQQDFEVANVMRASSLQAALTLARTMNSRDGEICVIGGGQLYAEAIGQAGRLYITHVDAEPPGDVFFPKIGEKDWRAVHSEFIAASESDSADMRLVVYERRAQPGKIAG